MKHEWHVSMNSDNRDIITNIVIIWIHVHKVESIVARFAVKSQTIFQLVAYITSV